MEEGRRWKMRKEKVKDVRGISGVELREVMGKVKGGKAEEMDKGR